MFWTESDDCDVISFFIPFLSSVVCASLYKMNSADLINLSLLNSYRKQWATACVCTPVLPVLGLFKQYAISTCDVHLPSSEWPCNISSSNKSNWLSWLKVSLAFQLLTSPSGHSAQMPPNWHTEGSLSESAVFNNFRSIPAPSLPAWPCKGGSRRLPRGNLRRPVVTCWPSLQAAALAFLSPVLVWQGTSPASHNRNARWRCEGISTHVLYLYVQSGRGGNQHTHPSSHPSQELLQSQMENIVTLNTVMVRSGQQQVLFPLMGQYVFVF